MKKARSLLLLLLAAAIILPASGAFATFGYLQSIEKKIPVLSEEYQGWNAHLHQFSQDNSMEVVSIMGGPDKLYYLKLKSIRPVDQNITTVYFAENGYVLTHVQHETFDLYGYILQRAFDDAGNLPVRDSTNRWEGRMNRSVSPSWGPGPNYTVDDSCALRAGDKVTVYFEENGYFHIGFNSARGLVRLWVPEDAVDL